MIRYGSYAFGPFADMGIRRRCHATCLSIPSVLQHVMDDHPWYYLTVAGHGRSQSNGPNMACRSFVFDLDVATCWLKLRIALSRTLFMCVLYFFCIFFNESKYRAWETCRKRMMRTASPSLRKISTPQISLQRTMEWLKCTKGCMFYSGYPRMTYMGW